MPGWTGSDRRSRLPANWESIRKQAFKRDDYRCTWTDERGVRCPEPATDADHRVPNDDHSLANIRSLCEVHHLRKSGREGALALAKLKRKNAMKFKRVEKHPGLL